MGANAGPDIVSDGLVLALDAADNNSFRGEPTTNILGTYVDPTFENGTTSGDGWAFDAKTDGIRAYNSLNPYAGSYCMELTNSTVSSIAFWRSNIPVVSGTKYTMTVYAKNIDCPTTPYFSGVNISLDSGENSSFSGINSEWKRFKATYTATATGNAQFYIRTGANATQGSFLIDNFQIEEKSYATRFTTGTRGTTVATGGGWADISGNDNHGEILNGTSTSNDGSVLGALDFDGTNDLVNINIDSWIRTVDDITVEGVIKIPLGASLTGGPWAVLTDHSTNTEKDGFWWHMRLGGGYTYFRVEDTVYGERGITFSNPSTFSSGNTYHIVTVVGTNGVYIYNNGELVENYNPPFNWADISSSHTAILNIGRTYPGYWLNSSIYTIKVYDRALSASEILANYNSQKTRFGL